MNGPAADAEQHTLAGGDAVGRAVRVSDGVELHYSPRLGVEDKTYRTDPGAGHTLDFEPDRSRYLADMLTWLSARLPSGPSRPTGGGP